MNAKAKTRVKAAQGETMKSCVDATIAMAMTERDLMDTVLEYLRASGYLVFHPYDSRRSEPGFPDMVAAGNGRLLFIECKRHGQGLRQGKMGRRRWLPGQDEWKEVLCQCPGVEFRVVRPLDWLSGDFQRFIEEEGRNGHKG
jgi:hypothetical protein